MAERSKAILPRRPVRLPAGRRLTFLDVRSPLVRQGIERQVAQLDPASEEEAMRWIEAVSEFDHPRKPAAQSE